MQPPAKIELWEASRSCDRATVDVSGWMSAKPPPGRFATIIGSRGSTPWQGKPAGRPFSTDVLDSGIAFEPVIDMRFVTKVLTN